MRRAGQVPEGHLLAEHRPEPAGMRQRADEHVRRLPPRRVRQLEPVPLDLLTRRMVDLRRRRPPAPLLTDQTHRPQPGPSQLTDQRRIRAIEPSLGQLVEQRHGREVRVIDEPGGDIRPPRLKTARRPLPRRHRAGGQILADRLAVPARVPADRRLIPAARGQGMYLHVVLLCEHPHRSLSLVMASEPMTVRGTPDRRAPRAGIDYGSFLRNSPTSNPARAVYALPGVGNSGDRI